MTGDVERDLAIARDLARAGIPVFCAYPDLEGKTQSGRATGYILRTGWENTTPNSAYVNAWKPGMALCAVMGYGLDLIDADPRNGGDLAALNGIMPEVLGEAASPSGGNHAFVASMGVRSRDDVLPGIDVKAGTPDGGRGFAFIAPTVRKSKVTGQPAAYRWTRPPDLSRLGTGSPDSKLAGLVRQAHGKTRTSPGFQQPGGHSDGWTDPDIAQLIREGIPRGEVQQPILRDAVARLAGQGYDRVVCWGIWQAIVDRTALTDPAWPWTEPDFTDMYDSAARKYGTGPREAIPADTADAVLDDLAEIAAAFTPVDWRAAWDAKPDEIQWLIEPLIETGQSVALYATPGTGKSLLALELAAALATGRAVLGNPPRRPVTVVYIDVENRQPSLVERLQAYQYAPGDLGRLVLFSFPSIAALDSLTGGQQILALAVTHQAAIVIIDTTSRVVAGKENDADTYLAFYRHTVIPLRARGIAMLRLDHPGKDVSRGTRGSSAKKGDVDAEWLLTKLSENTFGLDRQKERENHGDPHLALRRSSDPLCHEVTTGSGDRAGELAAELDRLDVPPGTGRVIAGKALRDAGIKVRGTDLAAALRRRNAIPFQPPITPPPNDSQSMGTARNRTVGSDPAGGGSHRPHSGGNREPSPIPTEVGSCAWCGEPCRRYGDGGRPLCDNCQGGAR